MYTHTHTHTHAHIHTHTHTHTLTPVAALWVGLSGTGPPNLVFSPPSLLARQVFWPTYFFVFGPPSFLAVNKFISNLLNRLIIV